MYEYGTRYHGRVLVPGSAGRVPGTYKSTRLPYDSNFTVKQTSYYSYE